MQEINERCINSQCIPAAYVKRGEKKKWTQAACIWRTEHMEGEVSSQLFLLHSFCSLVPSVLSFSWSEPPALWQKSASPSEGQASSCKGCSLREDGLQVKLKAGRLCRNGMGNWLYKARTIIWVTSDTFPPIPADILPPSCRDLRLHAESLRLNIDAHL